MPFDLQQYTFKLIDPNRKSEKLIYRGNSATVTIFEKKKLAKYYELVK